MSNDSQKSGTKQFTQETRPTPQADTLDAQYKRIGISAVSGAFAAKTHEDKSSEQMN